MTLPSREAIIQLLGTRGAMNDFTLFVGRSTEIRKLEGVAGAPHNCAWLHGPPRNGKSSLARLIADRARRSGKRVSLVDVADVDAGDFEEILARAVVGAGQPHPPRDNARTAFCRLMDRKEPLLIVFDEFDRHAMRLGLDEQACLRSQKETHASLNYLFVTRTDPKNIVEDVSVVRSRLLGICSVINVPILDAGDVGKLCQIVAEAFALDCGTRWAAEILGAIGAQPAAVVELLFHVVTRDHVDDGGVKAAIDVERGTLIDALRNHWRSLPSPCRLFLRSGDPIEGELRISAEREGYWNRRREESLRPAMLLEVAIVEGLTSVDDALGDPVYALVERVHRLLIVINLTSGLAALPQVFAPPGSVFFRHYELTRPVRNTHDLQIAVRQVARTIYDGGRKRVGRDETAWRIENERARTRFANAIGISMLHDLDQHCSSPDGDTARRARVEAWLRETCGTARPQHPAEFDRIIRRLLEQAAEALETLEGDLRDPDFAVPDGTRSRSESCAALHSKVDFAIITIKPEEEWALLKRLAKPQEVTGRRTYKIHRVPTRDGHYCVATVRQPEQGENAATRVTADLITDLDPAWILIVGIGGAFPSTDLTLGDVILGQRILDFSVSAVLEGGLVQEATRGEGAHAAVENLLACLPGWKFEYEDGSVLGSWHKSIEEPRPPVALEDDSLYYGGNESRALVKASLAHRFGVAAKPFAPDVCTGSIASSNLLVKDSALVDRWRAVSRELKAVEMEAAGVFKAAKTLQKTYPVLAIRGISDVVGFRRDERWTRYACESAAALTTALLAARPIEPRQD